MNSEERCPKCGSSERIADVAVRTRGGEGVARVVGEVARHPNAFLFKGEIDSPLKAVVCGQCGFTEFYVEEPAELLEADRVRRTERG